MRNADGSFFCPGQRCGQPGQQHGLRLPSWRLEQPHSIRCARVSAFLADVIQQIHSFRASGVMSSHVANALALEVSAFFRSAGRSWTTPPEIALLLKASLASPSPRQSRTLFHIRLWQECKRDGNVLWRRKSGRRYWPAGAGLDGSPFNCAMTSSISSLDRDGSGMGATFNTAVAVASYKIDGQQLFFPNAR
jgi:hypothetical protein